MKPTRWPTWGSCRRSAGLLGATPPEGQRLLFSATLDGEVDVLARRFLARPARHDVDAAGPPAQLAHYLLTVPPSERTAVVAAWPAVKAGR